MAPEADAAQIGGGADITETKAAKDAVDRAAATAADGGKAKGSKGVLDIVEIGYAESASAEQREETGGIEAAVAAFAALEGVPEGERGGGAFLPKASEKFPFGVKDRPAKSKFNLKAYCKALLTNKAALTNMGPVLVLGLLIYSMVFVLAERPYLMLLNGEPIAYVQKEETGRKLLEQANLELSSPYPAESNFRQYAEITYTREGVGIKTKPTDELTVLNTLKSGITWFIDAWTISVSNERTVFLASRTQAEEVLANVKQSYLPDGTEVTVVDAEFVEPVELIKEEIPVTDLGSPDQAFRTLTEGREPLREYTVQTGDSFWSVASANNMTVDDLKLINGVTDNNLRVGQVLKLNAPKPLLSVKTTVSAVIREDIPYETVYQPNSEAWQGQSKVVKGGTPGTKEIKYEVAQINGIAVEQKVLSETVIAEPVAEIVENGTKIIVASRSESGEAAGGALAWPIRGRINSPFGPRSRGFHSGIDIQARTGDPVYSAGAGTVISASYFAGYGNQVTVDHGDGLSTMYAHLSQINVSMGQALGAQELVGLAGTTGRTTGPHLHFEVRIDGSAVNPVNYLN